jgi:ABC-type branched-subunit amino acid transport system permease subunit
LIFGRGKILHFGPIGVSLTTAYVIGITLIHTNNFLLAFAVGLLAAITISTLFFWLSLRLDSDSFGVMSIAVHLSLLAVILNWNSVTRGALGIPKIPRLPFLHDVGDFAVISVIISIVSIIVMHKINQSSFGRKMGAISEHEWYAAALGIEKPKTHWLAFLIGAACITLSNFISPQYFTLLHPNDYQFSALVFVVTLVVAGNPGSTLGVTLSTILLILLKEGLRFIPMDPSILGPVRLLLFGCILFIAVWWRKDTLFPQSRRI